MKLFAQLTKVDVEKRLVYGRATQEVPDKSGEIFDYASSKPLFEAWSGEFEKATDGKSLGNVRAMHKKDHAAGRLEQLAFNDDEKAIDICAKVVDDQDWQKVQEGVYTGFSIGGEYEKRWTDPENPALKRFTAKPTEISLVDNPCNAEARFTMVKADGASEEKAFAKIEVIVEQTETKPTLAKSLYNVSALCDLLCSVRNMAMDAEAEKGWEGDDSPVPAKLRSWLADGAGILKAMTDEELSEMMESVTPDDLEVEVIAMSAKTGELSKSLLKAKSSKSLIQKVHDHSVALGAGCGDMDKSAPTGDLAKVAGDLEALRGTHETLAKKADDLAKVNETLTTQVTTLTGERDELQKKLEKTPADDGKGVQRVTTAVAKTADNGSLSDDESAAIDALAGKSPEEVSVALMKAAQKRGTHYGTKPALPR